MIVGKSCYDTFSAKNCLFHVWRNGRETWPTWKSIKRMKAQLPNFLFNQAHTTLPLKAWSQFSYLGARSQPISVLWCKFKHITLKTCRSCRSHELYCGIHIWQNVYQEHVTLSLLIWSEFSDPSAHAQPNFLLWCKFITMTLKDCSM